MSISAFGSADASMSECQLVRIALSTLDGWMNCRLFTTPTICGPLTVQPVTLCAGMYEHLMGLKLADPSDGNSVAEVDLLIGSDYYWELVTGRISCGVDGPVAMETLLNVSRGVYKLNIHILSIYAVDLGFCQAQPQRLNQRGGEDGRYFKGILGVGVSGNIWIESVSSSGV